MPAIKRERSFVTKLREGQETALISKNKTISDSQPTEKKEEEKIVDDKVNNVFLS